MVAESNAVSGQEGVVILPSGTVIEIRNWQIGRPQDILDVSSMSSGGDRQKKFGMRDWSGSFETIKFVDLRGQAGVASFQVGAAASATTPIFSGTIYVSDAPVSVPYDDVVTFAHTFDGSGPCHAATS